MSSRHLAKANLPLRILAKAAFISILLLGLIHPAGAKGPESATISGPGIDEPIELVDVTNPERLAKLMEQTGLWYATGDRPHPVEAPAGKLGPAYTLTWINGGPPGDSLEARTIRQLIYLNADGGLLIYTPVQDSLQNWGPGLTGWFAAPAGLPDTLAGLGVPLPAASALGPLPVSPLGAIVFLALVAAGTGLLALLIQRDGVRSRIAWPAKSSSPVE